MSPQRQEYKSVCVYMCEQNKSLKLSGNWFQKVVQSGEKSRWDLISSGVLCIQSPSAELSALTCFSSASFPVVDILGAGTRSQVHPSNR